MGTTPMGRIRTIVTGVAGAPYFMTGYFSDTDLSVQAAIDAWHQFCTDAESARPVNAQYTTLGEVALVDPVSGDTVGVEQGVDRVYVGSTVADILPRQTQLLVRWRTGQYIDGREVRGRTFMPLQFEAVNSAQGNPQADHRAGVQSRINTLINSSTLNLCVWSKKNGVWYDATSGSVWDQWATLRSRRD